MSGDHKPDLFFSICLLNALEFVQRFVIKLFSYSRHNSWICCTIYGLLDVFRNEGSLMIFMIHSVKYDM